MNPGKGVYITKEVFSDRLCSLANSTRKVKQKPSAMKHPVSHG